MEFSNSSRGMMRALAVLLSQGNGEGSGDLRSTDPLIGSWAGDRIVVAGDYAAEDDPITVCRGDEKRAEDNIYMHARRNYTNVSSRIQNVIREAGERGRYSDEAK